MSDENKKLIARFLETDYARIRNFVRGLINNAYEDNEDIVNDVLAGIFERADISRPIENVAAYVYRALRNRIIDILRSRKNMSEYIEDNADPGFASDAADLPERLFEKNEISSAIHKAVTGLPEDLRSVFIMNEGEGKSFREISELTGIPPGTLMARKSRAMEILRKKLTDLKIYMED